MSNTDTLPPRQVSEYRLVRFLGRGGMGEVYEAESPEGVHVAIKLFTVQGGNDQFLQRRFLAEGRLLARLAHANLVRVYEVGVTPVEGTPYLVMDLVLDAEGKSCTLADVRKAGAVDEARAERWYAQLCDALRRCHAAGVVHRDVKLDNVLVDAQGNAVLSDFGVARILDPKVRDELQVTTTFIEGQTTGTRPVMGTFWYLAPELRAGMPAQPASDWYALGVLFFRLLTGMWYEPGTDAFDLLEPFDRKWRERLQWLLSEDPEQRMPLDDVSALGHVQATLHRWWWPFLVGGAFLLVVLLVVFGRGKPSVERPEPMAKWDSATPMAMSLDYDAQTCFDFRPCPAGTNEYRSIAVSITRPYWLGRTPVTRRQWFAVLGEPLQAWTGGEDAPMTYVTRAEMTNFCARLTARFSARLPEGYEIRLPTSAEWRLAFLTGRTTTNMFNSVSKEDRQARCEVGLFGAGPGGTTRQAGLRAYYEERNLPVPKVKEIWPDFPPQVISPNRDGWMRTYSQFAPAAVATKRPNDLGLYDMYGNCYERMADLVPFCDRSWSRTEWGVVSKELYRGMGMAVTNPVDRSGTYSVMLGTYLTPDLPGADVWWAPFDRMPYLGFRLCVGPKLED